MPRLINLTKTLAAANAAIICASQTPGAAGLMTLVSSPVVLDTQRRVLITCAGNNSGVTFTISGTNQSGNAISETVAGPNATTGQSLLDYLTVTAISISAASTGAVTVGTSAAGSTPWQVLDTRVDTFGLSVKCTVTGTVTFSVETTNSPVQIAGVVNVAATTVAAATAAAEYATAVPSHAWRLTITAGTGSVAADAVQNG